MCSTLDQVAKAGAGFKSLKEETAPLFKADSATLSFYATKDGKISVSYQGWDQSKTVLAGQQFVVTWSQGQVEARIVERRQRRLAPPQLRSVSVTKTLL